VFNREEKRREEKREKKDCVIFDQFWALYPRKTSKQLASKAFAKLSDENQQKAIANIARLYANTEVQFVPHAATYLNQARWEDQTIVRNNTFARPLTESEDADLPYFR
jgi:ABC-type glutathione transport system ATPase component